MLVVAFITLKHIQTRATVCVRFLFFPFLIFVFTFGRFLPFRLTPGFDSSSPAKGKEKRKNISHNVSRLHAKFMFAICEFYFFELRVNVRCRRCQYMRLCLYIHIYSTRQQHITCIQRTALLWMPNKFISNIWFRATTLRNGKLPDSMCVRFVRPNESDNHFVCRSAWRWNALTRHIRLLFTCASTIDASPSSPHTVGVFFCSYTLSSFCRPSINVLFSFWMFRSNKHWRHGIVKKKRWQKKQRTASSRQKKNNQNKRIAYPNKTIVLLNICATWGNLFRFFLGAVISFLYLCL